VENKMEHYFELVQIMKKQVLAGLVLLLYFPLMQAQNCSLYPNTTDLLWNNSVKKVIMTAHQGISNEKFISQIYFLDSAGNCYKEVHRDQNKQYYYAKWTLYGANPSEYISGHFDKDSNEVIDSKSSTWYDKQGRLIKREDMSSYSGLYTCSGTMYTYSNTQSREMSSTYYTLDHKKDTIRKAFDRQSGLVNTSYSMEKINGKWVERRRVELTKNEKGQTIWVKEFDNGKLSSSLEYKYNTDGSSEMISYDDENQISRRTVYYKDHDIQYIYENGKEVYQYLNQYPIADPVDNDLIQELPYDSPVDTSLDDKQTKPLPPPVRKPVKTEPRKVDTHFNNDPALPIGIHEEYGSNGLILIQDQLNNNVRIYWSYEYY
jgi:hypothetical protein